jgi:CHASE3 domain sensor protein
MISYYIILFLIILILILSYTTYNLLTKNEKQEDILSGYMTYLNKISDAIEHSDKKLKEVDYKGSFKSDDEIGFIFEQIKIIQEILNVFIIKEIKK